MEQWATFRALLGGETILQFQETIHQSQGDSLPVLVNAVPLTFSYWQAVETDLESASELDDSSATGGYSLPMRTRA